MKIPTRPRRGLEFNITPMIDVVFLLIIFFLVSTHFVRSESQETVVLPSATLSSEEPPPRQLIVTVLPDGSFHAGGGPATLASVEAMLIEDVAAGLDDFGVLIRSDEAAHYVTIEPLLLTCARHGVTKIYFAKRDR